MHRQLYLRNRLLCGPISTDHSIWITWGREMDKAREIERDPSKINKMPNLYLNYIYEWSDGFKPQSIFFFFRCRWMLIIMTLQLWTNNAILIIYNAIHVAHILPWLELLLFCVSVSVCLCVSFSLTHTHTNTFSFQPLLQYRIAHSSNHSCLCILKWCRCKVFPLVCPLYHLLWLSNVTTIYWLEYYISAYIFILTLKWSHNAKHKLELVSKYNYHLISINWQI